MLEKTTESTRISANAAQSFRIDKKPHRYRPVVAWFLLLLLPLFGAVQNDPAWAGKRLYRWVDQDGNVHYSDKIPPSQAAQGHDELSKQGVTEKTVEPPKSKEEYLREKEMERLRAEQKKLIEEQEAADKALLATYRVEDEILLARDGKIAAIDANINVILSNLQRHKRMLANLQSEAAGHERRGQKIPPKLQGRIDETEKAIGSNYEAIVRREQQKDTLRAEFDSTLNRFRGLKQLPTKPGNGGAQTSQRARTFTDLDNVVVCEGSESCGKLWGRAKDFAERNATTALQLYGPNIHITALPTTDKDISITLSLIPDSKNKHSVIFMDLQCNRSPVGQAFCEGPDVETIRKSFKGYVRQTQ